MDGSVYHWWHPLAEFGNHTACSDDYLWLPLIIAAYIKETGDTAILNFREAFVDAGLCARRHPRIGVHGIQAASRSGNFETCAEVSDESGTSMASSAETSAGVRKGRIAACSASACGQVRRR